MAVDISSYFRDRRNQFHKVASQRLWRTNPFRSLVKMSEFPMEEGTSPTVINYTHELPAAYPTLAAIPVSNGTGNPACNPTPTTIKRGQTERTFSIGTASFKSDVFCLSDIKRAHQAAEAVTAFEKGMKEYLTVTWGDLYRLWNISQVDQKVVTKGTGVEVTSTAADFTGVGTGNLPDVDLDWGLLKEIYFDLVRRGVVDEYAVGTANGKPVIPLIAGPGILSKLWNDSVTREEVKYFDPKTNLQIMGYGEAVNGFLPVLDVFPIRFGKVTTGITAVSELTQANMLYPTENVAATIGQKYQNKTNYKTVARGGLAQFEVVSILPKEVYETLYEPSSPSAFSSLMSFKPADYSAEWSFINQPTFQGDNDRGNLGYYLADLRVGARTLNPDLAKTIITKAVDTIT